MSTYKTRPIEEIFEWRGVKLQVVEKDTCDSCFFKNDSGCFSYRNETGYCGESLREDNKSVIFKPIFE